MFLRYHKMRRRPSLLLFPAAGLFYTGAEELPLGLRLIENRHVLDFRITVVLVLIDFRRIDFKI